MLSVPSSGHRQYLETVKWSRGSASPMLGTIANALAIVAGSIMGLSLGKHLSERQIDSSRKAMGLVVGYIGMRMLSEEASLLATLLALVVGTILGEALDIDSFVKRIGDRLKSAVKNESDFSAGFYSSTILFLTGPMAILGPIREATSGDLSLLLSKSFLDGFCSLTMSASMGVSVAFSSVPVIIYQGCMYLLGMELGQFLPAKMIGAVTATGGALVLAIGLNLLDVTDLRVGNMIPCLIIVAILTSFPLP